MKRSSSAATLAAAFLLVCSAGIASAQTVPAATPAPAVTAPPPPNCSAPSASAKRPKANALIFSGCARMYDFDRLNKTQNSSNPNRSAFNVGGLVKVEYHVASSPFYLGAGYYGAYPFGVNGVNPQLNSHIDNSVPGFALSTMGQAYARYDNSFTKVAAGNLLASSAWMPSSDTRIKPSLYQAVDGTFAIDSHLDITANRTLQFENRTQSQFERQTLLSTKTTNGALDGGLSYHNGDQFAKLSYYSFYDYANMAYFEGGVGLAPNSFYRPTLSVQYVTEAQAGRAIIGKINNNTLGFKIGANYTKNIAVSVGFDTSPWRYATVTSDSLTDAEKGYFIPAGGSGAGQTLSSTLYKIAYGGIASPYTDSYTSDPLYTTSLTQGMVERRGGGNAFKGIFTYTTDNKQLVVMLSGAVYDYSNAIAINNTIESDVDVTYRFNKVKSGPYQGLVLRERYGNRSQDTLPFTFQSVRSQLEYDFTKL